MGRLLGIGFFLFEVGDQDVCPFAGEGQGNCPSDARIPTGYDRRLALQAPVTAVGFVPVAMLVYVQCYVGAVVGRPKASPCQRGVLDMRS
jgi:hypothetical protein